MSVVGLTLGSRRTPAGRPRPAQRAWPPARARAPAACRARTSRSRPRGRAPSTTRQASCQLTGPPAAVRSARRPAPATARRRRSRARPRSRSDGRRRARRRACRRRSPPLPEQHHAVGERGRELRVVRGHHDRRAPPRQRGDALGSASLWARSIPRVGSSSSTAARVAGQHHLEREPLALAAGEVARVGLLAALEPGGRHARGPASSTACSWIR